MCRMIIGYHQAYKSLAVVSNSVVWGAMVLAAMLCVNVRMGQRVTTLMGRVSAASDSEASFANREVSAGQTWTHCGLEISYVMVITITGSGNGLLLIGSKPSSEPAITYH